MTPRHSVLVSSMAAAAATATLLAGALWVQHARAGWPFTPGEPAAVARAASVPVAMAMETSSTDDRVAIEVDASMIEALDVRLEMVRRETMTETVRAPATIVPDETSLSHVHTRVAGWIEELAVRSTGERVTAGQPLAQIFSQALLSSQAEYLAARHHTSTSGITSAVVAGGRSRLSVLGMSPSEIEEIERTGEPRRLVTVVAPRNGVVVNRGVTVGTSVDSSTTLFTIADLSRVWVLAEVAEADITAVRVGTTAQVDVPASGRAPFRARVDFVYPMLTERTRTLRVRLPVANPSGTLRPGVYGTVTFESAGRAVLTVPREAIVDTGREQHVFVASGNRFEPRVVSLGVRVGDRVEVRSGLEEGEHVVGAGLFLLDSESRLRATGGAGMHSHGAMPAPEDPAPATAVDPHAGH